MSNKMQTKKEILAVVLHELNPALTTEQWMEHIEKTAHDPKQFFGNNGQGYEEYQAFVSTYDKDKRKKQMKKGNK